MLRLGLTGGIASGKSAVAAMLREMGFAVLDADSLAHKLIEPGQPAYDEVLQEFGQAEAWKRAGIRDAVFVEAALLIESGIHKKLDGLVVAWCSPEQQLERLLTRGLSEGEARRRIAAQLPVEEKLLLATEKIDCSGSLEATRRQVETLAAKLRRAQSAQP